MQTCNGKYTPYKNFAASYKRKIIREDIFYYDIYKGIDNGQTFICIYIYQKYINIKRVRKVELHECNYR